MLIPSPKAIDKLIIHRPHVNRAGRRRLHYNLLVWGRGWVEMGHFTLRMRHLNGKKVPLCQTDDETCEIELFSKILVRLNVVRI